MKSFKALQTQQKPVIRNKVSLRHRIAVKEMKKIIDAQIQKSKYNSS